MVLIVVLHGVITVFGPFSNEKEAENFMDKRYGGESWHGDRIFEIRRLETPS